MSTSTIPIVLIKPGASPVRSGQETPRIMISVVGALLPAAACGCFLFGAQAALTLAVCIVSCMIFEAILCSLQRRTWTLGDFSALVTGLLLALILPPATPIAVCIAASFAAIVIAKYAFGGLGTNVFNPALVGRVLCTAAFPAALSTFIAPVRTFLPVDAITSATPLALLKYQGLVAFAKVYGDPAHRYLHLLLGNHGGSLGETSVIALWIGGIFLMARRVISWHIPVAMYGAVAVIAVLARPLTGDPLSHLLSGGLALSALFIATDYVTSPSYPLGKLIFGAGCGCLTMFIRIWGLYAEGCMYAILVMNILVPFIDRVTTPRPFGVPDEQLSFARRLMETLTALRKQWVAGLLFLRLPADTTQGQQDKSSLRSLALNPLVMIGLGLAPLVAVATGVHAAFALAVGLLAVQILTFLVLICLRPFIVKPLAPLFVVVVAAGWTAALRMVCHAYLPDLPIRDTLSCWLLPALLPTVNLSWLLFDNSGSSSESGGYRKWIFANVGLGIALCLLAAIREVLGTGTLAQISVSAKPVLTWALTSSGGCVVAALLLLAAAPLFDSRSTEGKE
jgi:Na+-translocating ferredoxin:NAD+ oxidoreductase subunit D